MNFFGLFTGNKDAVPAATTDFCKFHPLFISWPSHAQDLTESDVSLIVKKAREDAEKMTLPVNKYSEEGLKAAEATSRLFHSPEFQERVQCEQQRLEKEVFGQYTAPWKKKTQQAAAEQAGPQGSLAAGEKVLLFISSSVPDETVHAYIAGIDKAADPNVSLVMRGMVGGMSFARPKRAIVFQQDFEKRAGLPSNGKTM